MVTRAEIDAAAMFLQRTKNYPAHDFPTEARKWEVRHILDICGIEYEKD